MAEYKPLIDDLSSSSCGSKSHIFTELKNIFGEIVEKNNSGNAIRKMSGIIPKFKSKDECFQRVLAIYSTSLLILKKHVELQAFFSRKDLWSGNPDVQFALGMSFLSSKKYDEAKKFLLQAAAAGHERASFTLRAVWGEETKK